MQSDGLLAQYEFQFPCGRCKAVFPMTEFTLGGLQTSHRVCVACRKLNHGKVNAKLQKRKEEDPWLKKLITLRLKIRKEDVRRAWTTEKLRILWEAGEKRCMMTGKPVDENNIAFVPVDSCQELTPTNIAIVHRTVSRRRSKDSFSWSEEQMKRIDNVKRFMKSIT